MTVQKLLYLSREDVEAIDLPMIEIINALEEMFQEKGAGRTEMPPKPGIHPKPDAFIHAMPAFIQKSRAAGIKWVSGFPDNPQQDLPYISGLIILNDPDTGIPLAVMDATWITAKRTGAATAVAAKYLARKDSSSVGILACGVQGRSNLEALSCLFEIDRVHAYDISPESAKKYQEDMKNKIPGKIRIVDQPRDAVLGMDLVVTSGPIFKVPDPTIEPGWLSPGSFASLVDFDSYWQGGALRQVDKLATDDRQQLEAYRDAGYFQDTPSPYADLGEIVSGQFPGREDGNERTMTMNLGLALADMVTAKLVYEKALQLGKGTSLNL
jgi:ornithine cyclodeaminase/alanine dehydrogenase